MAKAKRGRPRGERTETFPIRLPTRLLDSLRKEARRRKLTVTRLLIETLEADYAPVLEDEPHAGTLKLLLDLVVRSFNPLFDRQDRPIFQWWESPFAIESILLAFGTVVRALGPKGDMAPPELRGDWTAPGLSLDSFKSPAARAEIMAEFVLAQWRAAQQPDAAYELRAEAWFKDLGHKGPREHVAREKLLVQARKRWTKA